MNTSFSTIVQGFEILLIQRPATQPLATVLLATVLLVTVLLVTLCGTPVAAQEASIDAKVLRCSKVLNESNARLIRTDLRALGRCGLALLDSASNRSAAVACKGLHTYRDGLDRLDRRVRKRVRRACGPSLPRILPDPCSTLKGQLGDLADAPVCATTRAHCWAAEIFISSMGDMRSLLQAEDPQNWDFEFGEIQGNSFAACRIPAWGTTTSSTTTTTTSTTSTTTSSTSTTTEITTGGGASTTTTTLDGPGKSSTTSSSTTTTVAGATTTSTLNTGGAPLRITEFLADPSAQADSAGEFFEITNVSQRAVLLSGLQVRDGGSDAFTVSDALQIEAGAYMVFGRSASAAGGLVDYVYGRAMTLANSADEIVLILDGVEIDRVEYGPGWPLKAGRSTQLDPSDLSETKPVPKRRWCLSEFVMADGDLATPKHANHACPAAP